MSISEDQKSYKDSNDIGGGAGGGADYISSNPANTNHIAENITFKKEEQLCEICNHEYIPMSIIVGNQTIVEFCMACSGLMIKELITNWQTKVLNNKKEIKECNIE